LFLGGDVYLVGVVLMSVDGRVWLSVVCMSVFYGVLLCVWCFFDVKNVLFLGDVEEDVCMEISSGFGFRGGTNKAY
jgi:hypothetical protein